MVLMYYYENKNVCTILFQNFNIKLNSMKYYKNNFYVSLYYIYFVFLYNNNILQYKISSMVIIFNKYTTLFVSNKLTQC